MPAASSSLCKMTQGHHAGYGAAVCVSTSCAHASNFQLQQALLRNRSAFHAACAVWCSTPAAGCVLQVQCTSLCAHAACCGNMIPDQKALHISTCNDTLHCTQFLYASPHVHNGMYACTVMEHQHSALPCIHSMSLEMHAYIDTNIIHACIHTHRHTYIHV